MLVVKLLNGLDARSRSGLVIRAALEQPLLINGKEAAAAGAIVTFRYRIAADRQDRRQLAYILEPQSIEIGQHRVPIKAVEPAKGTPPIEGRGQQFLLLLPGTVLTIVVR